MKDLGVNFCFSEANIGQPRDAVCVPKLQELNKVLRKKTKKLGILFLVVFSTFFLFFLK